MPIADTEFLYASALLRAKEGQGISRDRFERMADARSVDEICRQLGECGVTPVYDGEGGRFDLDRTLASVWQEAAALVRRLSPVKGLFDYLLYPYDANDLKACLKTSVSGEEPEGMLFACGTVPPADLRNAVKTQDFSGDPQNVDLPIDRACFADMLASTEREPFLHALIRLRIDLYHVRCTARAVRMGDALPAPEAYLKRLFVPGTRDTYHMEYGFSNMGYETNGALGVKLAAPDREVYTFFGDGTYLMAHSELVTCLQEHLRVHFCLFAMQGHELLDKEDEFFARQHHKRIF